MSPQIDLDEEIFDFLKSKAEPFVDTPNSVLRRLLGINSAHSGKTNGDVTSKTAVDRPKARDSKATKRAAKTAKPKRTRAATGTLLPEDRYEPPLLKALADLGGQAPYRDVVQRVGDELKDELLPADFENLNSGGIRWQSRLQFVRLRLVERGFLDKDSPRGIWAITAAGRAALAEGQRP